MSDFERLKDELLEELREDEDVLLGLIASFIVLTDLYLGLCDLVHPGEVENRCQRGYDPFSLIMSALYPKLGLSPDSASFLKKLAEFSNHPEFSGELTDAYKTMTEALSGEPPLQPRQSKPGGGTLGLGGVGKFFGDLEDASLSVDVPLFRKRSMEEHDE